MDTAAPPLPPSLAGAPPQQWIASPSPVYLTGEEALRLSLLSNVGGVTVTLTGRVLRPDNTICRINITLAPTSNRVITTAITALSEGWLLGLTLRATAGAPAFGQVWALLELGNSLGSTFAVDQTLGYGFLTANTPYQWPNGVNLLTLDGPANLRSIAGTTPAVGVDISETVPTGARWALLSFYGILVASATAANRQPVLMLDDGANTYFAACVPANLTASVSWQVSWANGIQPLQSLPARPVLSALPVGVQLGAGHRIRTVTSSIQVDDQWSSVRYLVREWMTGE